MKTREYHIKFDVEKGGKAINSVCVQLGRRIERNMSKKFAVNLCDDPLYPALCEYVMANPPRDD